MNKEFHPRIVPIELNRLENPSSFLQSPFWGAFKSAFDWKPLAFKIFWDGVNDDGAGGAGESGDGVSGLAKRESEILVLWRRLAGPLAIAYIPWGDVFSEALSAGEGRSGGGALSGEQALSANEARSAEEAARFGEAAYSERGDLLIVFARELKKFLPKNTTFLRFDPPWATEGKDNFPPPLKKPFVPAPANIQPPDTVLLDLTPSSEEILACMKNKWRYNIRLGTKNVTIKQFECRTARDEIPVRLEVFYELFRETSLRDGISMHSIDYYKKLFELANSNQDGAKISLYLAEYESKAIAGIVVLHFRKAATYLYGASSNSHRNLMANYALQWRAICDAKETGCTSYDFFGIPPDENPAHPMAGLYRFKTGFGGKIIHRPCSFDFPYNKPLYALFSLAEKAKKRR